MDPDPELMVDFCQRVLPGMLIDGCGVAEGTAQGIGRDVLGRAEAVAVLDPEYVEVLTAPFLEEVFDHEPVDAPWWLKAATTLVVRNSRLEEVHSGGPVNAGELKAITTHGLGPLSHLLAAGRRGLLAADRIGQANPFVALDRAYPQAWACASQIRLALKTGGRIGYCAPTMSLPSLPAETEIVEARGSSDDPDVMVLSATDPRFDQQMVARMRTAAAGKVGLITVSALSRFSRNSTKLLRVPEFFLAYDVSVLTTNLLLESSAVWARRGRLVKPDSSRPFDGLRVTKGLGGNHRKAAANMLQQLAEQGRTDGDATR